MWDEAIQYCRITKYEKTPKHSALENKIQPESHLVKSRRRFLMNEISKVKQIDNLGLITYVHGRVTWLYYGLLQTEIHFSQTVCTVEP